MLFSILLLAASVATSEAAPKVEYSPSCGRYKAALNQRLSAAVSRLRDCLHFAYVRPDITERMLRVLDGSYATIRLRCDEPPRASWCAAAGWGEIWMSPSKMLEKGSFCHNDIEQYFIHEVAHLAGLKMASTHNEDGDLGFADEVYSLVNYCMRPARMWLHRARRTYDVVDLLKVSCMNEYQELTPETLVDPFWEAYRPMLLRGQDPCEPGAVENARKTPVPLNSGRKGH